MKDFEYEIQKEMYEYEINRKDVLNNKVSLYITLLTGFSGIAIYIIKNLIGNVNINLILQLEGLSIIIVLIVANFYSLFNANNMLGYWYIPNSKIMQKKFSEVEDFYSQYFEDFRNKSETKEELISKMKIKYFEEVLIESATLNKEVNDIRTEKNLEFTKLLFFSLIIIGIIGVIIIGFEKPLEIIIKNI